MDLVYSFVPLVFRISKMVLVRYNTFFLFLAPLALLVYVSVGVSHPKNVQHHYIIYYIILYYIILYYIILYYIILYYIILYIVLVYIILYYISYYILFYIILYYIIYYINLFLHE